MTIIVLLAVPVSAAALTGLLGGRPARLDLGLLLVVALAVAAQRLPFEFVRRGGNEAIDVSSAFVIGLAICRGPAAAVLAQVLTMVLAAGFSSRSWVKQAFNVAQQVLAVAAAGAAAVAIGGVPFVSFQHEVDLRAILAFAAAAITYMALNGAAVTTVCALVERAPVIAFLRRELFATVGPESLLLVLAPLTAALLALEPLLLPLLVPPMLAAWYSGRQAVIAHNQARRDPLTGLPNRLDLREGMLAWTQGARRDDEIAAVVIDLDGFKEVNDTLGHDAGDQLLVAVSARFTGAVADRGRVGRLQGDEFAAILHADRGLSDALDVAADVETAFEAPFDVEGLALEIGVSVGVAAVGAGTDPAELLRRADVAMYEAKRGRVPAVAYRPELDGHSPARLTMMGALRTGLANGEIVPFFQPQVDLRSGAVVGAEALVRWLRSDGTMVSPGDFIPQAENTGLIRPLTLTVLEAAARSREAWAGAGREVRVAVNMSVRSLLDPHTVADVVHILETTGLHPENLELEITETALMADPERAERTLRQLHDLGIALSVDDFGTGYSSLGYLGRLPVQSVKVDRSFVGVLDTHTATVIVRSIADLGRSLDLQVVAEGVEDVTTEGRLRELGCHLAQGFLWSPAVPAAAFAAVADRIERDGLARQLEGGRVSARPAVR